MHEVEMGRRLPTGRYDRKQVRMRNACVALRNVSYLDCMPSEVAGIRTQLLVQAK